MDPGESIDIVACGDAALLVRDHLAADRITVYAMPRGAKGLRLLAVIMPTSCGQVTTHVKAIGAELGPEKPDFMTTRMAKASLRGKVFLDRSQARRPAATPTPHAPGLRRRCRGRNWLPPPSPPTSIEFTIEPWSAAVAC